jgi:tetratricopeptide (TPR) repeat protein
MLENFPVAYPAWFTEGFAEYYMTAEISSDGRQVKVGGYNQGRVNSVFLEQWLPWNDVLTKRVSQMKPDQVAVFYAQSWLLMHYMRSDETRARQLNAAVDAISKGEDPARAFWKATGETPEQLTRELRAYRRLPMAIAEMKPTAPPAITVTKLPPSADDLLIDHFRLLIADDKSDPAFLADVRRKAARYPDDSFAQMTLARAEFEMGDVAAAETIVQRRLDARPDDREALLLAGVGKMIAGVRDSAKRRQYFNEARPLMAKVYALDPSDFRPLYAYALCRSADPAFPTENDVDVLLEARELAPSVQEISFRAGLALLRRERREDALKVLGPVLNDPHGGGMAERARALIEGKGDAAGDESAPPDAG